MMVLFMIMWLAGCATASLMNRVSLGMSKEEVERKIGQPNTTKANSDGTQILEYVLYNSYTGMYDQYWVILKSGKVVQFGRAGDFGNARVVPY
ncbi:MAG: hypothetical protein PHN57_01450 [Candidatus Omnitrophica bacterium]|nr:hypothetical protein [Candidatus Omnitrophota bacterium]